MRAIHLKLLRELRRHWMQVLSIALVMGCGTMTITGLRSTLSSIRKARDNYYTDYRFADVFARLERAPTPIAARLERLPGIATVETRIVRDVKLDLPGVNEPVAGHMVSIPDARRPMLNELHVRRGRWVSPGRDDEVLISERFAELNHLAPGDAITAVINGKRQALHITGIAISPEFVVEFAAGALFADSRRYCILWTGPKTLETAFDMKGAFNDVIIRLAPGAQARGVMADVDEILKPWGGAGAYVRSDQAAARALENEFSQLAANAAVFPMFFLIVAAFLLNVVLSRLVASQRDEIAALKAFGYSDREVGTHYLMFGVVSVALGAALGIPMGIWMAAKFNALYATYFRFPTMPAVIDWGAAALAVSISGGFALLGALSGVQRVMKLAPAEALRPETPSRFRPLILERLGLASRMSPGARLVFRNIERRPIRAASSVLGIALAVALLASGRFPYDAFARMMEVSFGISQRYDAIASFINARPLRAAREIAHVNGVLRAVPFRATGVRIVRGPVSRTTSITGLEPDDDMYRLTDIDGHVFRSPASGVAITKQYATRFGVHVGDTIDVELLELGVHRSVVIVGIINPMIGQGLFTSRVELNRLLREGDMVSGVHLAIAPGRSSSVFAALKEFPAVAGATSRAVTIHNIDEQTRESMVFVLTLIITSACLIAMGVVYNGVRIALSERGRELASLRVLGFTTKEVTTLLLGEQSIVAALAAPIGVAIGALFSYALSTAFRSEEFQFPLVIALHSQVFAAGVVLASGAIAALTVRRRVRRLDMVAALRTRE